MRYKQQTKTKDQDGKRRPLDANVIPPIRETERCPNCGTLYYLGECNHHSSIKTAWGGSTLYGVCKKCKETHDGMAV